MKFRKTMTSMMVALALAAGAGTAFCQNKDAAEDALKAAAETAKVQIAKLRGRLLYKKSQIRKLEKSACESNPALKTKMEEMEKEKRQSYIAVESKLESLYSEQDVLENEIQKLTGKAE
ncbi:MAG: hypothetical protein IKR81_16265 [Victivallales bacterium]|nr:hypothetical protein [Victivallales bacterium]